MPAGRPRKPEHLKALEGNPGKRSLNTNAPAADGRPVRPAHVKGYAAKVWTQVVNSMPPELYGACDSQILVAFCLSADLLRAAAVKLALADEVEEVSKWAAIQCKAATTMATAGGKLGLDPAARSSLVVPQREKQQGKFAELIPISGGRKG